MTDESPRMEVPTQANTPGADVIREFNDRGTLWLLEDPEHLRSLIQILEPELADRLDTDHAERVNRSLIPADLQKKESDLIFRIPFRTDSAGRRQCRCIDLCPFGTSEQTRPPDGAASVSVFGTVVGYAITHLARHSTWYSISLAASSASCFLHRHR